MSLVRSGLYPAALALCLSTACHMRAQTQAPSVEAPGEGAGDGGQVQSWTMECAQINQHVQLPMDREMTEAFWAHHTTDEMDARLLWMSVSGALVRAWSR